MRPTQVESLEARRLLSNYFVSPLGSDGNPGTLDRPFATIQEAASVAGPGDTVYVRGGTYRETVRPLHSGMALAPITFEPYHGAAVTISGTDPIAQWNSYRGTIYQGNQPWDLGDGNNQLFVDGAVLSEARTPAAGSDLFHPATFVADTLSTTASPNGPFGRTETATITSSSLTDPAGTWTGATIHIAPGEGWVWQTGTVISDRPGQLTYRYTQLNLGYQVPRSGNRFYLSGVLAGLDAPGEWFHDAASGALYLWMPQGESPAGHDIEVKHRQNAFDLGGRSYITVHGFNLFAATISTDSTSHDLLFSHFNAAYVSQQTIEPDPFSDKSSPPTTGILLNGSRITLADSAVAFSSGNGVAVAGSDNVVENCFIHDVDYSGADGSGILLAGPGNQVLHNSVYDAGRNGITDYFAPGEEITHNLVHDIGLMTSDAGGIYTYHTDGAGTEIAYNVIYNARATGFGNTGIFLDNGGSDFVIHHNLVWNADNALKLSAPAHNDQVYNNTLVGQSFSLGTNYPPDMAGSIVENNILDGPIWWGSGVVQRNNLTGNPGFVDPRSANYQLGSGSSAIDAGMLIPPYTDGFAGAAPDLGAMESGRPSFDAGAVASPLTAGGLGTPSTPPSPTLPVPTSAFSRITPPGEAASIAAGVPLLLGELDFGSGARLLRIMFAISGRSRKLRLQLRLDGASGPILVTVNAHGRSEHMQTARPARVTGVHNLYVVVLGSGQVEVNWLTFLALPTRRSPARHPHGRI